MMCSLNDIKLLLESILSDKSRKLSNIEKFQSIVWDEKVNFSEHINEYLADLAQDLDYY